MQPEQHYAGDQLAGLQEIPLPEPVSYVPQTIGWAVAGGVLLLALIYVSWRVVRHRRANAYRREALAELAAIETAVLAQATPSLPSPASGGGKEKILPSAAGGGGKEKIPPFAAGGGGNEKILPSTAGGGGKDPAPPSAQRGEVGWGALPELLKRTAIAATSREQVASLTGDDWLRFLDRSLGGDEFNNGPGKLLTRIAYATAPPEDVSRDQLESLITLSRRWIKHHHADV